MNRGIVPPSESGRRWFPAALSVVSLVLIVIAVPIALYLAGGLPLSHLPYRHVSQAVTSAHSYDRQLVAHWLSQGALLLAWVAWAWMTVCVVREVKAWADGRSSTALPASRTMQSIAACLVGTALAMSTGGRQAYVPGVARPVSVGSTLSATATAPGGQPIRVLADVASLFDTGFDAIPSAGAADRVELARPPEDQPNMSRQDHVELLRTLERTDESDTPDPGTATKVRASTAVSYSESARSRLQINAPVPPDARPIDVGPADPRPADTGAAPSITVHLVASRETLWSIATDKLGSALRWKEIAELNYQVRQPDGKSLDLNHWIRPGWRLILPAPEGADSAGVGTRTRPAEPAWFMADGGLSDAGPSDEHNEGASMYPGTDATAETAPEFATGNHPRQVATADPSPPLSPMGGPRAPSMPLGAGVMGAGVVNILDRMRRVQQRHRRGGMFIQLPDHSQQDFEQRVRLSDGEEITAEVDGSLRLFTRLRAAAGREVPIVTGVRVQSEAIEITMEEPGGLPFDGELPDEFRLLADGHTLAVDRLALREIIGMTSEARTLRSPAPLMATVGQGPDGLVMVNLESLGSVLVNGDPEACEGMVRALALELATSHWADQFDLALVGFGAELERFVRVTSHIDVPALINQLCRRSIDGGAVLRSTGFNSFFQARCVENSSVWDPLVVLCGPGVSQEDLLELLEVAGHPHNGTAIVAVGEQTGDARMVTLPDSTPGSSLELLGSVVYPQQIALDELNRVTALLDTASARESVPFDAEPYVSLSMALPDSRVVETMTGRGDITGDAGSIGPGVYPGTNPVARDAGPSVQTSASVAQASHSSAQGWNQTGSATSGFTGLVTMEGEVDPELEVDIEVAVLGPVAIRGAMRPFTRAWAEELVVYLAMHPNGASNEAWSTALWPDRIMAPSSLHSTASVARRSLGQTADGRDHLPRSHGRLALADSVGSDWARFVVLAGSADVVNWRRAVELVRGRPFEGLRSSDWPVLEGIGPAIEAAVVDVSGRLAGAYLAAGDARGAEWSARKGLLVSPYDERLYRMLMRSSDLAGNPAGVEAVMAELVKLVADDVEPFDSVHPSTMDLYRSLTRRRTTSSGTVTSRADRRSALSREPSPGGSARRRPPTGT